MKKLALLLAVGLLAACGGSGSSSETSTNSGTNSTPTEVATQSSVTFDITKPAAKTLNLSVNYPNLPPATDATANMRRLIITNTLIPSLANLKWTLDDYPQISTKPTLSLPVANGYVVEVLDYGRPAQAFARYTSIRTNEFKGYSTNGHPLYGNVFTAMPASTVYGATFTPTHYKRLTGVNIVAGANTITISLDLITAPGITLSASPITAYIDAARVVPNAEKYTVTATIPALGPYNTSSWSFRGAYTNSVLTAQTIQSVNGALISLLQKGPFALNTNVSPPVAYPNWYVWGQFDLRPSLVKTGDGSAFSYAAPQTATLTYASGNITAP